MSSSPVATEERIPSGASDFARFWVGQTVSVIGDQVAAFALPTVAILLLHASPIQIGLLGATSFLAYPIVGLFAGAWVDRLPRRAVLIGADVVRCAAIGSIPIAAVSGWLSLVQLYAVGLVTGVAAVFFDAAYQAYVPALVGRDQLTMANSRLATSSSMAQVGGPSLAGWLVQASGGAGAMALDAASYLGSIISLLLIRTPERRPASRRGSLLPEVRAGLRVVLGDPILRGLVLSSAVANFGRGMAFELVLLYAYRGLHLTPTVAGIVLSAGSIGALVGAVISGPLAGRLGVGRTLQLSAVAKGLPWVAAPLALLGGAVPILITVSTISGLFIPIWNVTNVSLRQSLVDDDMQGRVAATARTVTWGTIPVAALLAGILGQFASDAWGPGPGLAGVLTLGGCIWAASVFLLPVGPLRAIRTAADAERGT